MDNILLQVANFLNNNRYIKSLKDGFSLAFPFTLVSSIMLSFSFLTKDFVNENIFTFLIDFISPAIIFTSGILSFFLSIGIGYSLSNHYKINALNGALVSVISFLIQLPFENTNSLNNFINIYDLGYHSLFSAILVSILSVELYRFLIEKFAHIFENKPNAILQSVTNFIPLSIIMILSLCTRFLFEKTTYQSLINVVYTFSQEPLTRLCTSFLATIFIAVLCNLFWYFGLHGQAMIYSFMMVFWSSLNAHNIQSLLVLGTTPNLISSSFIGANVTLGGWISVPFLLAVFIYKKRKDWIKTAKSTLFSGIFNIYEPIMFSFPIVFNKNFLIPLILTPIITTTVIYKSMEFGFIPFATGVQLPLTTPLVLAGILTTNSLKGGLLQLILIPILTIMWLFFIKKADFKDKD